MVVCPMEHIVLTWVRDMQKHQIQTYIMYKVKIERSTLMEIKVLMVELHMSRFKLWGEFRRQGRICKFYNRIYDQEQNAPDPGFLGVKVMGQQLVDQFQFL